MGLMRDHRVKIGIWRMDAVVVRCSKLAYVGFVNLCNKGNFARRLVVRHGEKVHLELFMDGKCNSARDDCHGVLPGDVLEMESAWC